MTARLSWALAALAALVATGCGSARFTPYSHMSVKPRVATWSIAVYRGDLDYLAAAGAEIVGYATVSSTRPAWNARQAAKISTRNGGTHHFCESVDVSVDERRLRPATSTSTVSGNVIRATHDPGASLRVATYQGQYLVVRVDTARWLDLPTPLRPAPINQ